MTTKSIQQRAEDYAFDNVTATFTSEGDYFTLQDVEQAYTAGATDERRELGKVILGMAEILDNLSALSAMAQHQVEINTELIASLREELK